jgi:hypothetical protein
MFKTIRSFLSDPTGARALRRELDALRMECMRSKQDARKAWSVEAPDSLVDLACRTIAEQVYDTVSFIDDPEWEPDDVDTRTVQNAEAPLSDCRRAWTSYRTELADVLAYNGYPDLAARARALPLMTSAAALLSRPVPAAPEGGAEV